jgi:hypothetical protein
LACADGPLGAAGGFVSVGLTFLATRLGLSITQGALVVSHSTVTTYVAVSIVYAFFVGVVWSAYTTVVLDAIGVSAAATKFSVMASLATSRSGGWACCSGRCRTGTAPPRRWRQKRSWASSPSRCSRWLRPTPGARWGGSGKGSTRELPIRENRSSRWHGCHGTVPVDLMSFRSAASPAGKNC